MPDPAPDHTSAFVRGDLPSLLRASLEVFRRHGFDAASIGDLAEYLGLNRGTIYYYVPSKGELLRLALEPALTALEAIPLQRGASLGPAFDRLLFVLREMVTVLTNHATAVAVLISLRGNLAIEREAICRHRAVEQEIIKLVSLARDEGALRADVDPDTAGRLLVGTLNSITDWYSKRGPISPSQLAEDIISLTFSGLKTSSGSPSAV
jgi:AcrR family transcriptional regulator